MRPYALLEDGVGRGARFEQREFNGAPKDLATMALEVVGGSSDSWLLAIYADTGRGCSFLGQIRTLPWGTGTRTVAICAHPGAIAWEVRGRRVVPQASWLAYDSAIQPIAGDPAALSSNPRLGVNMTGTPMVGGEWGVKPIRGLAERGAKSLYKSGIADFFTLRGNIIGWTAWNNNAADGVVQLNAGDQIIVPGSGGFVQGGQVLYKGYANAFGFFGTSAYRVDYEVENPFEGAL